MNPTKRYLGKPLTIFRGRGVGQTIQAYVEQQGHLAPDAGDRGVLLGTDDGNGNEDRGNCYGLGADDARELCIWLLQHGYGPPGGAL